MRKGVSPLIAGVLLIAFTLAVAAIVSGWLTAMTRTETQTIETGMRQQINCTKALLEVVDAVCNGTDVLVTVANIGPIDVSNVHSYVSNGTTTCTSSSPLSDLDAGGLGTITVGSCDIPNGNVLTVVRVNALCQGVTGLSIEKTNVDC